MALILDYDKNQLEVGQEIKAKISNNLTDSLEDLASKINEYKSSLSKYKINLEDTIDTSDIETSSGEFFYEIDLSEQLAITEGTAVDKYQKGEISAETFSMGTTQILRESRPNASSRLLATVAMAGTKFTEGFVGFFEDIGDVACGALAWTTGKLGNKKASSVLRDWATTNNFDELVEGTDFYAKINKDSYFDGNSLPAKIFKGLGKVTAAAVTVKGTSSVVNKLMGSASDGSKLKKVYDVVDDFSGDKNTAEYIAKKGKSGIMTVKDAYNNIKDQRKRGLSMKESVFIGLGATAVDTGLRKLTEKGVNKTSGKVSQYLNTSGISDKIKSSKLGAAASTFKNSKISSSVEAVTNTTGENIIDNYTGNFFEGNGNLASTQDTIITDGAKSTFTAVMKTVKNVFKE